MKLLIKLLPWVLIGFCLGARADEAPPTRLVGGCNLSGKICFGPSLTVSLTAYDFSHKTVVASFSPGLGYGVTFNQNKWNAVGLDIYVQMQTGAQEGVTLSALFKFANGYGRVGVAWRVLSGEKSWLLPVGLGFDL